VNNLSNSVKMNERLRIKIIKNNDLIASWVSYIARIRRLNSLITLCHSSFRQVEAYFIKTPNLI